MTQVLKFQNGGGGWIALFSFARSCGVEPDGSHLRRNATPYAVASGIPHPQTKKRTCVMTQALKFQNGGGGW